MPFFERAFVADGEAMRSESEEGLGLGTSLLMVSMVQSVRLRTRMAGKR